MYQTRDELLNMLANSREPLKALQKNKRKINKLEKRIHKRLYLLFALITLGPLVLMYFIDAQRGNIIEAIRYGLMPSIIPGFDMIYLILNFALVILFIYSMRSVRKEDSYLMRVPFIQKIVDKVQFPITQKIDDLVSENHNIIHTSGLVQIPDRYRHSRAINKIYGYLKDHRADSLKEAYNLYEYEMQQMAEAQAQAAELSRIKRSVQEAEKAAQQQEAYSRQAAADSAEARNILRRINNR